MRHYLNLVVATAIVATCALFARPIHAQSTLLDSSFVGWGGSLGGVPAGKTVTASTNAGCLDLPNDAQTITVAAQVVKPDQNPTQPVDILLSIGTSDPPQVLSTKISPYAAQQWTIDVGSSTGSPLCYTLTSRVTGPDGSYGQSGHQWTTHLTVTAD